MIPKTNGVTERDNETTLAQTWAKMEDALEKGKVKNIGISNFTKSEVEELLQTAKHVPDVMQIETHPFLQQQAYIDWLVSKGIIVTAYSPLGNLNPTYGVSAGGKTVDNEVIKEIAESKSRQPCWVVLADLDTPRIRQDTQPDPPVLGRHS